MKKEDLNRFKGEIKDAIQSWGENKINSLFPQEARRSFFKKGLINLLDKEDERINKWLDAGFLFVADENGIIDSDVMIDTLTSLFEEMDSRVYQLGMIKLSIGKGQAIIELPRNFLVDMLVGELGIVKFTSSDISELKSFLN